MRRDNNRKERKVRKVTTYLIHPHNRHQHIYIHPQHMDKSNTTSTDTKDTQKAFDPYAPHKIKWWGWPLLILLIAGTVYVYQTSHESSNKKDATAM